MGRGSGSEGQAVGANLNETRDWGTAISDGERVISKERQVKGGVVGGPWIGLVDGVEEVGSQVSLSGKGTGPRTCLMAPWWTWWWTALRDEWWALVGVGGCFQESRGPSASADCMQGPGPLPSLAVFEISLAFHRTLVPGIQAPAEPPHSPAYPLPTSKSHQAMDKQNKLPWPWAPKSPQSSISPFRCLPDPSEPYRPFNFSSPALSIASLQSPVGPRPRASFVGVVADFQSYLANGMTRGCP